MSKYRGIIIDAYRRIYKAAKKGRGVRLSAEEVEHIIEHDAAIRHAVEASYCDQCGKDNIKAVVADQFPSLCDECYAELPDEEKRDY